MRRLSIFVALATVVLAGVARRAEAQGVTCRIASNSSTALRKYIQTMVSSSSSSSAATRAGLGIQTMDTSAVTLVSTDSVCTAVTQAVDSAFGNASSPDAFIVVQFGSLYAAYDPDLTGSGPSSIFIVNATFTYVKSITGF